MEIFIQKILEHYNLQPYIEYVKTIASIVEFFLAVVLLGIVKYFWSNFQEYQLSKNLSPFWEKSDIVKYTKYFIPTRAQDISPSEKEELKDSHKHYASNHLISYFLENALADKDENKYYLILADTGMGKTAFMINLYLAYRLQKFQFWKLNFWKNLFFGLNEIQLFPLGRPDVLEKIDSIEKAKRKNTILLLDAFDEDTEAIKDYENRMKEIVEKTQDFHDIIITCRTQFFPSEKAEPSETGIMRFGSEKGHYEFFKKYISPFSEKDIKLFLRKRYGVLKFWNYFKKKRAKRIIEQVPNLRVRPMLLSYIDDLLISESKFYYTYEIYEELIRKWVKREANNYKKDRRDSFEEQLNLFSRKIAIDMYLKREERNGFFIDGNSIGVFAIEHNIDLSAMELKGRSLLNRNVQGYYKFAHKSILEYYLALELVHTENFRKDFQFESMSFAKELFQEIFFVKNVITEIEKYDPKLFSLIPSKVDKINIDDVQALYKEIKFSENILDAYLIGLDYLFTKVVENLKIEDKVKAFFLRGLDCGYLENPHLDIHNFTKVIELQPDHSKAYYYRGHAYSDLRNSQKAIEDFSKAIELWPSNSDSHFHRGELYFDLKKYAMAIEDYSHVIQLNYVSNKVYEKPLFKRALCYSIVGNYDLAILDYKECVEMNSDNSHYHFYFAQILFIVNRDEEAIESLNRAFSLNPTSIALLLRLWFYTFAHIRDRREEAEIKLQQLIEENGGEKISDNLFFPDWDFNKNIEKAINGGHPRPDLLKEFAMKISGNGNNNRLMSMIINGNVSFEGNKGIENLGTLKEVVGDLDISKCIWLEDLGELEKVGGNLYASDCDRLESLGRLKFVGGDIILNNCLNLKGLSPLEYVGKNLVITFCDKLDYPFFDDLKNVGGEIFLKGSSIERERDRIKEHPLIDKCNWRDNYDNFEYTP